MSHFTPEQIQIGISSCLLGQKVRYDGGHKASRYCLDELSSVFSFVPTCPEMGIGMGAPRKTIRLVDHDGDIRARASDDSFDVTEQLHSYAEQKTAELNYLSGYIVCAKSPTCGMERVKVYPAKGGPTSSTGVGLFTQKLMDTWPLLPVEEEGRLNDQVLRENFITRVYAYHDWHRVKQEGLTRHALIQFHSRYKLLVMAHHQDSYRALGRLLGNLSDNIEQDATTYFEGFMRALMHHATRKSHTNVLQHIQGYFSSRLTPRQREELSTQISKYRQGLLPLLVPMTLLKHYLGEWEDPYIAQQVYLNPHPEELKLHYAY